MKKIACIALILLGFYQSQAQTKIHKVVFQLATSDTLVQKSLVRQINHLIDYWPTAIVEVVVHNEGINFMEKQKSVVISGINDLKVKGVTFAVCENTMKRKKLNKSDILDAGTFVPVGVAEIALKQEENYSYIKAGY